MNKMPHLLQEVIPADRCLDVGGSRIKDSLALWFRLSPDTGGLPDWSSFRPFEHPSLLPHVSVCKRDEADYRCVLMGEVVQNWMVRKVQGEFIHDAFPSDNADDVVARFERAFEDERPNYTKKTMGWNNERGFVRYHNLHLPFVSARDGSDRILSVFEFDTPTR